MTQEIRHTVRPRDNDTVLLAGEIAYADSDTIKVGDGDKTFAELPSFSTNSSMADNSTMGTNTSNKLQALGTINKNSSDSGSVVFDWIGTSQQYSTQKQAGQIDPNWLCFITDDVSGGSSTDMYTKAEIDGFLANKADGVGGAVMVSGDQTIEGNKTFIDGHIKAKSTQVDSTTTPLETLYPSMIESFDKNGKKIGSLYSSQDTYGGIWITMQSHINVNNSNVDGPFISSYISQDGQTKKLLAGQKPATNSNDSQIATTEYVMDILKTIYPVGSVYIGTQNSCPMGVFFGTWELVSSGKALWTGTGSNGNSTIAAGLPNITGNTGGCVNNGTPRGAFYQSTEVSTAGGGAGRFYENGFDASRSSSIYGNSTTVQPPAYVVNVWRRTA